MWVTTLLLCGVLTATVDLAEAKIGMDADTEAAVQSVFREMLRIEPPSDHVRSSAVPPPPKHMLELYRKYAAGGGPRKTTGNTVRSIVPITGESPRPGGVTSPDLVLFNVTCVEQSEEVHLAQLHLHRRRLARHQHWHSRRMLAPPYRVRLYQISTGTRGSSTGRTRTMPLASVPVPHATRGGWHALDITAVLRELLLNTQGQLLLGVRFEAPKGRPIPPEHFLRESEANSSNAFLVVFSEDSPDNGLSDDGSEPTHLHFPPPHTHAMAEMLHSAGGGTLATQDDLHFTDDTILPPVEDFVQMNKTDEDFYLESSDSPIENEIDTSYRHKHRSKTYQDTPESESNSLEIDPNLYTVPKSRKNDESSSRRNSGRRHRNQDVSNQPEEESGSRRMIRSILDNELPDGEQASAKRIPKTSPETLLAVRPSAKPKSKQNIIPLPAGSPGSGGKRLRGNRRRKGRGRKRGEHKKRPRHRASDDVSERENEWVPEEDKNHSVPLCQRKKLVVNFADIGWDDFIVAPDMFEAHYCAGDCRFPLSKALKPTNHATIQSLLHVTGHRPEVPAPCCVPDALSPVSMLYLDSARNVVLKTYPSMAVDSCACR